MWKLLNSNSIVSIFDAITLAETDILMLSNQKVSLSIHMWSIQIDTKTLQQLQIVLICKLYEKEFSI